jgi:hypothetical protein
MTESTKRKLRVAAYVTQVIVLLSICLVVAYLYTSAWGIARFYPWSIEYEGHVLWSAQLLAKGSNIYDPNSLTHQPWCVVIYNPLYLLVGAALCKLLGVLFWPLRMLTMCSTLATFLGLFVILDRCRLREFFSIIGLALFSSCLPVFYWSAVARVDMFGLALAVWGIERFVANWLDQEKNGKFSISLLSSLSLFVLAFFAKQQYLVFPLACLLFYCIKGQIRFGLKYFGSWLVVVLTLSSVIQIVTGGYWAHLSYATGLPWEWNTFKQFWLPFLQDYKTIASFFVIVAGMLFSKKKAPAEELALCLLVSSLLLVSYTMGLRGAYHNHLLCTELALFWLAVLNLGKLSSAFSALIIVAAVFSLQGMTFYLDVLKCRIGLWTQTRETIARLQNSQLKGKTVLFEDPYTAMLLEATPAMIDGTTIINMSSRHPDVLEQLTASIKKREYAAILINSQDAERGSSAIWPPAIVKIIKENYRLTGNSGGNGIKQSLFEPAPDNGLR